VITHTGYVDGGDDIHTNMIEGFWSNVKRGIATSQMKKRNASMRVSPFALF